MERRSRTRRHLRWSCAVAALLAASACEVEDPRPTDALAETPASRPERIVDDLAYGAQTDQVLDVIRPSSRPTNRRAILWLHGGGWVFGDENELPPVLVDLVERDGYTVFAVRYRLSGATPYPAAVEDVDLATRWVKAHAGDYAVDPRRLVTFGFSSGAHLALLAGLSGGAFAPADLPAELAAIDSSPAGIVALAAPTDLDGFAAYTPGGAEMVLGFLGCASMEACDPALVVAATPQTWADPSDPVVYLAQGDLDHVVPVSPTDAVAAELEQAIGFTDVWYDRVDSGPDAVRGHDLDFGLNRTMLGLFIGTVEPR